MNEIKSVMTSEEMKSLIKSISLRFILAPIFLGIFILIPAGTFDFWQFYIYTAIVFIPMIFVLIYFLKNDPKFLVRRTKIIEKEKSQVFIQLTFLIIFISGFIISGLDRRFGWSSIPVYVVILTDFVMLLGYLIIFKVFKQNSYASRIVEVESNQKIITDGLYKIVRHPMYVGVLIMWLPLPIALGSYWALIPMAAIPFVLVFRIFNEEAVLKRDLSGYAEYCQTTKYRLIPFIW